MKLPRVNVTGFTLDARHTRDIDDAVLVERKDKGWRVLVSISDVARAIAVGSDLDIAARELVATRYYSTGSSPMLPRELSEQALSLWPDHPKKTITIELHLTDELKVEHSAIYRSRLQSMGRLTYEEVPRILGDGDHLSNKPLRSAVELALRLLEVRRDAGALALYDLNNGWVTTEEGMLKKLDRDEATVGYILVQEFMILANAQIAQFCVLNNIPILFRNHTARVAAPSRDELMQRLAQAAHTPDAQIELVRQQTHLLLERAVYAPTLREHYGLNLPAYTHWTSPIRRYPDLVNHRQLCAFLYGETFPYTVDALQALSEHVNQELDSVRRDREEYLKTKADDRARQRAHDPRRLESLSAKEFERVVKVEARGGQDLSDVLADVFVRRMREDRLPLICAGVVFVEGPQLEGWNKLRAAIATWAQEHPEHAVSILNLATQAGWPPVIYSEESLGGPDHAPLFAACASLALKEVVATRPVPGSSRKEATQRAAVCLLAALANVVPPVYEVRRLASQPPKPKIVSRGPGDAISLLQELGQQQKLAPPQYQFEMAGPPHAPIVTCTVTFGGKTATCSAGSKQEAKRLAARGLLDQLAPDGVEGGHAPSAFVDVPRPG